LVLTTRCNLKCRYCYNDPSSAAMDMPEKVIQNAIALAAAGGQTFHLQLTGGEPTLTPELIQKAAAIARDTGRCSSIGIQTNATTCLTIELMDLFKVYAFQVGVSLDGPPEIQQLQRGMTSETLRGLRILDEAGIPFRVTTVVTRANVLKLDRLVLTLAGFSQVRGIGLDLLVDKGSLANPDRPAPASAQTLIDGVQKMLKTLDAVNARRAVPIRLRERDRLLLHEKNESAFCHTCRAESMAVQPDGKIFPCGQTSGYPQFFAGTVRPPRLEQLNALNRFKPLDAPCDTCPLKKICPGDCPSRLHYNRHHRPFQTCDLYRAIWNWAKNTKKPPGGKTP
jgi:uncharacterized protein